MRKKRHQLCTHLRTKKSSVMDAGRLVRQSWAETFLSGLGLKAAPKRRGGETGKV